MCIWKSFLVVVLIVFVYSTIPSFYQMLYRGKTRKNDLRKHLPYILNYVTSSYGIWIIFSYPHNLIRLYQVYYIIVWKGLYFSCLHENHDEFLIHNKLPWTEICQLNIQQLFINIFHTLMALKRHFWSLANWVICSIKSLRDKDRLFWCHICKINHMLQTSFSLCLQKLFILFFFFLNCTFVSIMEFLF